MMVWVPEFQERRMVEMNYNISLHEEDGVFVSRCRDPEVASCGDTPEEALDNIWEAIELYMMNARLLGIIRK